MGYCCTVHLEHGACGGALRERASHGLTSQMRGVDELIGALIRTIGLPLIIGGAGLLYLMDSDSDANLLIMGVAIVLIGEVIRRLSPP